MGIQYSRSSERVENADLPFASYRYPSKSGNYFSSHFIMGDQTFAGTHPESFLFGVNSDLNFLPPRPVSFPYPEAHKSEPTKLLRSLVNLRKDSLRLIKHTEKDAESDSYYIDFVFDADVKCAITIYYLTSEDVSTGRAVYTTKDTSLTSRSFEFDKGANQAFGSHGKFHPIRPSFFKETELIYSGNPNHIPVLIHITTVEEDYSGHSNITMANIEKLSDESYTIKLLKQKQMVDGVCYILHEIYGLESKEESENGEDKTGEDQEEDDDDDVDDYTDENVVCVVCMSEARDTLMLPCKHLCVCSECAGYLKRGSNNCPICRMPFHALLQLCAYQRATTAHRVKSDEQFRGYTKVDLFDALNAFNIGKDCASSREIVRRVSARAKSRSRPTTPKPGQRPSAEERMIRRSSSRFSRSSHGSHKRDMSDAANEPVDSLSKSSLRRSMKGSSKSLVKSHVIEVEDKSGLVDVKKAESSDDTIEGLELGVEVGQDNLGMDAVEEEDTTSQKPQESGCADVNDMAPSPLNVPLPGTPLNSDRNDTVSTRDVEPLPLNSSVEVLSDESNNVETLVV